MARPLRVFDGSFGRLQLIEVSAGDAPQSSQNPQIVIKQEGADFDVVVDGKPFRMTRDSVLFLHYASIGGRQYATQTYTLDRRSGRFEVCDYTGGSDQPVASYSGRPRTPLRPSSASMARPATVGGSTSGIVTKGRTRALRARGPRASAHASGTPSTSDTAAEIGRAHV